jgi:hypothetical protein
MNHFEAEVAILRCSMEDWCLAALTVGIHERRSVDIRAGTRQQLCDFKLSALGGDMEERSGFEPQHTSDETIREVAIRIDCFFTWL